MTGWRIHAHRGKEVIVAITAIKLRRSRRGAANVSQQLSRLDRVKLHSKLSAEMTTFLSKAWSPTAPIFHF
jgi:hypothetical protein